MFHGGFIEDEDVGQRAKDKIEHQAKEPDRRNVRKRFPQRAECRACATHHAMRKRVTSCRRQSSRGNWLIYAYFRGVKDR